MKKLTKAEEEIMQMIWDQEPCTVRDLINKMPSPKPPHSSISSIVRILERKGFAGHKAYGRTHVYHSLVDKKSYSRFSLKNLVSRYFEGSMNELVSFLVRQEDIKVEELQALIRELSAKNQKKQ